MPVLFSPKLFRPLFPFSLYLPIPFLRCAPAALDSGSEQTKMKTICTYFGSENSRILCRNGSTLKAEIFWIYGRHIGWKREILDSLVSFEQLGLVPDRTRPGTEETPALRQWCWFRITGLFQQSELQMIIGQANPNLICLS